MDAAKIVLFDFDGVIADSFRISFEVHKFFCPHLTEDEYKKVFEGNIHDWEKSAHTAECKPDADFFAEYVPRMQEMEIFPGVLDAVKELAGRYMLIVVSSTLTSPIRAFLKRHHAAEYFPEILGSDVDTDKSKKIQIVLQRYGTDAGQCVLITDTLGDIKEASRVGVRAIGVLWGFQDKTTLAKGNPAELVANPRELGDAVRRFFEQRGEV